MNRYLRGGARVQVVLLFWAWACGLEASAAASTSSAPQPSAAQYKAMQEEKALGGDGKAAREMATLYSDVPDGRSKYWTQIAAENGDPVSQYNYALLLLFESHDANDNSHARAVFWLRKSASAGNRYAKAKLVETHELLRGETTGDRPRF